jgi:hypothetical protein
MEFATVESDALFAEAHAEALRVYELQKSSAPDAADAEAMFLKQFPMIPAVGYAARDFSAFSIAQRPLVVDLLLQRRFRLAVAVTLEDGSCALASHAGITAREFEALGIAPSATPRTIAEALNAFPKVTEGSRRLGEPRGRRAQDWRYSYLARAGRCRALHDGLPSCADWRGRPHHGRRGNALGRPRTLSIVKVVRA